MRKEYKQMMDQLSPREELVEQVLARDNIACEMDSTVEELLTREGGLSGVTVRNRITGQAKQLEVEGLFIAVGQQPQNGPFSALIAVDEDGYLLAGEDCKTNVPGVFAAGDSRTKLLRQIVTAVADGAVAAHYAEEYLLSLAEGEGRA